MLVTAIVSGQKGDGQMVNMHVRIALGTPVRQRSQPLMVHGH